MRISEIKRKGYVPEETIYYDVICRTIAAPVAKLFMMLGLEANTVTLGMIVLGIASGISLAFGNIALGLVMMHLFLIVDASDGYVAKANDKCTMTGLYLDHLGHYVCHPAFIVGMSIALYRVTGNIWVLAAGGMAGWANMAERALRDTYYYVFLKHVCKCGIKYEFPPRQRSNTITYKMKSFFIGAMDFPFILNIFTVLFLVNIIFNTGTFAMEYVMLAYGVVLPLYMIYSVLKVFKGNRLDSIYSQIAGETGCQ